MAETHINAYVSELQLARDKAVQAIGEFEAAQSVLAAQPGYDKSMMVELPFRIAPLEATPVPKAGKDAPA